MVPSRRNLAGLMAEEGALTESQKWETSSTEADQAPVPLILSTTTICVSPSVNPVHKGSMRSALLVRPDGHRIAFAIWCEGPHQVVTTGRKHYPDRRCLAPGDVTRNETTLESAEFEARL